MEETRKSDGCFLVADSTPGGSRTNFNKGVTTVHAVGHWIDLIHIFYCGCQEIVGDGVADIPSALGNDGWPEKAPDICPELPGTDPIHNHMDCTRE